MHGADSKVLRHILRCVDVHLFRALSQLAFPCPFVRVIARTLKNETRPAYCVARRAKTGAMTLHGPHQTAWKSMMLIWVGDAVAALSSAIEAITLMLMLAVVQSRLEGRRLGELLSVGTVREQALAWGKLLPVEAIIGLSAVDLEPLARDVSSAHPAPIPDASSIRAQLGRRRAPRRRPSARLVAPQQRRQELAFGDDVDFGPPHPRRTCSGIR